ncbi:MAG TPA: BTAD domain-containing putative transcriptional regulator [Nocardioides sp.]|uniref:BTAD domain-containing putative transcriptional regulator n=1 Tax=Nocardioides sp. TaxID=35761 RepID=UPI002ED9C4AB
MSSRVPLRVLGPLEVMGADGTPIDVGSPRHVEVLAALAVDAGKVVSTEGLLTRVWGERSRGGTLANLQAIISRLRARLRTTGLEIATVLPGYRLELPPLATDLERFQVATAAARRAREDGDLPAARELLVEALGWWRGEAFAGISQAFARAEALRLDGLRQAAEEAAAEVDLELGDAASAIDRLQALAAAHPLRETVRGSLMRALYLGGRQADALAEYAALRDTLVEELGVDPGPDVQRLHQQILEQDPGLRPAPSSGPPAVVPRSRPAPVRNEAGARPRPPAGLPATDLLGELIGRDEAIEHLVDLLCSPDSRLVTLTGVGGAGKTRLAHAVAEAAAPYFPDGVALVPLARLTDPSAVIPTFARVLGVPEGADPLGALLELLRERRQLVLVDNAEHMVDAWPDLATLASFSPGLRLLVTSRIPLRVRGEVLFPVTPLDPESSVELFTLRARAVRHDFAGADDTTAALCRRLAGIPLAIELAAARVRMLRPQDILARLDEVMAAEGFRDLPPRQRTMRSAIGWSFDLLSPLEQRVFPRLSVFVGGFGLDAASAVLADVVEPAQVLAVLESLVEQSLLVAEPTDEHGPWFRLLEPVGQYAATRLEPDEARTARDAHLAHYVALAVAVEPAFRGPGTVSTLALVEREHANLVAALEWSLASGEPGHVEQGGWLGWNLWLFWWLRGNLRQGRRLMEAVLEHDVSDPVRVRAAAVVGAMAFAQGDLAGARIWSEGAALGRRTGDLDGEAHCVAGEALVALAEERLDEAAAACDAAIRLTEAADLRGQWMWTLSHVWLGTIELLRGRPEQAAALVDTAIAAGRAREDRLAVYIALFTAVQISVAAGDLARARTQLEEGILLSRDTGDHANLAYFLEALATVEALDGRLERVGVLSGAVEALRSGVGANVYGYYRPDEAMIAAAVKAAREGRGEEQYAADEAQGHALDVEAMIGYALT